MIRYIQKFKIEYRSIYTLYKKKLDKNNYFISVKKNYILYINDII